MVDHDAKFMSDVFLAVAKSMGSCLIVGSAYHKNTNAKVERANGVISDTLRSYANERKDDWDIHLTLAEFAINNAASALGDDLTPFFIDRGPTSSPTPVSSARRPCYRRVADAVRAADVGNGVNGARATSTRRSASRVEGEAGCGRVDTVFQIRDLVLHCS